MLCRMEIFVSYYVFFCYLTSLACICTTHRLLPVFLEQVTAVGAPGVSRCGCPAVAAY